MSEEEGARVGPDRLRPRENTTKEALNNAPGYTFDRTAYQWVPAKRG
jgi:hypothetical protein